MIVAATGFFDGVHLGHQMVIKKTVELARQCGGRSLIVTFWPHPRTVLQQDADRLRLLSSMEEKRRMCYALGIDDFVALPFTRDFAALTAEEFLSEYLADRYEVSTLVIGYDHRIGGDDIRDKEKFKSIVRSCGITPVFVDDSISSEGVPVSSTLVRARISEGDIASANALLGYKYALSGVVVSGNRIGRTIGFPTANMSLYDPLKLVPACGVYAVIAEVQGRRYRGICNIGYRPTLNDGRGQVIETNILDFDNDIYGVDIRIEFASRIRDEVKFSSLEELKVQLSLDEEQARAIEMQ